MPTPSRTKSSTSTTDEAAIQAMVKRMEPHRSKRMTDEQLVKKAKEAIKMQSPEFWKKVFLELSQQTNRFSSSFCIPNPLMELGVKMEEFKPVIESLTTCAMVGFRGNYDHNFIEHRGGRLDRLAFGLTPINAMEVDGAYVVPRFSTGSAFSSESVSIQQVDLAFIPEDGSMDAVKAVLHDRMTSHVTGALKSLRDRIDAYEVLAKKSLDAPNPEYQYHDYDKKFTLTLPNIGITPQVIMGFLRDMEESGLGKAVVKNS